jgi:hypothetical protein
MYNLNAKNQNLNKSNKNNYEINSFIYPYKGKNKGNKYISSKKKDKEKKNYSFNNNSYNSKSNNTNYNKNKYILTLSKGKENNFNFYLIKNYINQNEIKNNKSIPNINNNNFGKVQNIKNSVGCAPNFNFNQYYLSKFRKFNILKTIDLTEAYSLRYNTEVRNKNIHKSFIKQYNKINLKEENNKYKANYSQKISNNKKINIIIKSNSLSKDCNNNISNIGRKKNKIIKIKNIIINKDSQYNLLSNHSNKKDNSNKNINTILKCKSKKNKIDYKAINESKYNSYKIPSNQSERIINKNSKYYNTKSKYSKILPRINSKNLPKRKNKINIKEVKQKILNNNNNQNIIYKNDICNKKKLINSYTTKNIHNKFKELFPIEEVNKTFDSKYHTKTIKK